VFDQLLPKGDLMSRFSFFFVISILLFTIISCTGVGDPILPVLGDETAQQSQAVKPQNQSVLWGYFDLFFNTDSKTIEVTPNRTAEFTLNVVKFLNNSPTGVTVGFNGTTPGTGYIDLDMDVTIKHPMGLHEYDGYDVRGVFIGNGESALSYNPDLLYASEGLGQILLNADGYTRWFNPWEFMVPNIFGYVPGKLASSGYSGTATLNPYKYFGDGLGNNENLWDYLNSGDPQVGYFLAGTSNTRNYKIRFPIPVPGIKYGYAVVADWSSAAPQFHPSHAEEAVCVNVEDNSNVWYVDGSNNGGNLNLDISVFDWNAELTAGVMEDYAVRIESSLLSSVYSLSPAEMTPSASGEHWNTFHVEIPADNIIDTVGNEMWVIVEDSTADYTNPLGVPNAADTDKIAACFRYPVAVSSEEPLWIQVISPNGGEVWKAGSFNDITWDANMGIQNVSIFLSVNSGADYPQMLTPSTPNDGSFTWGPIPAEAVGDGCRVMISDLNNLSIYDTSDADFGVALPGIQVIQPNGGEQWEVGESGEIIWEADPGIASVMIFYSVNSGGSYNNFITFPTPNDGSYMWDPIPAGAAGTQDRVRVLDADNFDIYDDSDADFTVTMSSITLLTPNGGEEWDVGSSQDITWDADPEIQNIIIELSLNYGFNYSYVITPSTPNTGIFTWDPIPLAAASDNCRIRVGDADVQGVSDASDNNFRIISPWIDVTSPNGGEQLEGYMSWEITWDSSETGGAVYIEYSKDNFIADINVIASNTPNDGSFIWQEIPFDLSDTVRVRIFSAGPSMSDTSDSDFSIVAPPPFIRVLTPNGGEEWSCTSSEEITWLSYGLTGNVDLFYSTDNFVSDSNLIAGDVSNTGSYLWDVAGDISDTVRVMAKSADDPLVFDVSDADFSILEGGWARTWGDVSNDSFDSVVVDAEGNSYVVGTEYHYNDGDYSLAMIHKYDPAGQLVLDLKLGNEAYQNYCGAEAIAIDDAGYLYIFGYFQGAIDFDPGPGSDIHTSSAGFNFFLGKYDADGNWCWAKTWGGGGYISPVAVAVSQTDVYLTGYFDAVNMDFDPDPVDDDLHSTNGGYDVFLSRFDTSGNFGWAGTWGAGDMDWGAGVTVGNTGIVFVTGSFGGSVDFDPGPGNVTKGSNGELDAFLSRFDDEDNFLGVETWGGADDDGARSVAVDGLGNLYVAGWFGGVDIDLDPGGGTDLRSSNGEGDCFLSKFDSSGLYQWALAWGGSDDDDCYGVDTDELGNIVVAGSFESDTVDFDPGPGSDPHMTNGYEDAFFSKFDSSGNFLLARTWGSGDYDEAICVAAAESGDIFVCGYYEGGLVEFAPVGAPCFEDSDNHVCIGGDDCFLVKYMPDGCW